MKSLTIGLLSVIFGAFASAHAQNNGLARTPPMGWSSWNAFGCDVDDLKIRQAADAIVSSGMRDAGYEYVNIDDCWQGARDAKGEIHSNARFPDMKALADYVHAKGLKIGIYSSPGPKTCAGQEGSFRHEWQDAATFAAWGMDYLKYDWCYARLVYSNREMPAAYKLMGDALAKTGRKIVYSLCQYGREDVWKWGAQVGGNLWRTTGDILPNYQSILAVGFAQQAGLDRYAGPGHWNDPDMLEVGNGQLTEDEDRLHFTMWAMLAAPLIAGNNLTRMTPRIQAILTNREVIAIDQDPLGIEGHRVWQQGPVDIWARPLANHNTGVAIFNLGESARNVTVELSELGISQEVLVRNLWTHQNLGTSHDEITVEVPVHGVVALRIAVAPRR